MMLGSLTLAAFVVFFTLGAFLSDESPIVRVSNQALGSNPVFNKTGSPSVYGTGDGSW